MAKAEESSSVQASDLLKQARWAWGYAWSASRPLLLGFLVTSLVASALPAALAWAGRGLINAVSQIATEQSAMLSLAIPWLLMAFGMAALQETLGGASDYLRLQLDLKLQLEVTSKVLAHAAELDVSRFEDPTFQDVAERAQQNIGGHFSSFLDKSVRLITSLAQLLSFAAVLLLVDWGSVVAILALVGPYVVYRWFHARERFGKEYSRTTKRRWTRYFVSLLTNRNSVMEIKLSQLAPHLIGRYQALAREFLEEDRQLNRKDLVATTAFAVSYLLVFYVLFARLIDQVAAGSLTIGDIALFAAAITRTRSVLDTIARAVGGALEETLFVTNLAEFLSIQPRLTDGGTQRLAAGPVEVDVDQLQFTYPGSKRPVLQDVSLRIRAGETIAVVGENGAGKTTLVKLIARFYDPDAGTVKMNGTDLRQISLESLHQHTAFVFQQFNRYEARLWENIAYGDVERIDSAEAASLPASQVGLGDWIESLPDGYHTMLGRRFGNIDLSEGQWQKLMVARAIARRSAGLLILDEPTASLDARAEFELFTRFKELATGRTTILISHRFSTVRMADRIVVMDHGRIVETGTHRELVSAAGTYALLFDLHQRQMSVAS